MSDRIEVEGILYPGSELVSPSGEYTFTFQQDSNLVLYRNQGDGNREAIWDSGTYQSDPSPNAQALLQRDGNFVIYDGNGQALWASETFGYGGSQPYIVVQDDGNVVFYDAEMEGAFWNTGTYQG